MATTMEAAASHSLIQSESHVQRTYTETTETKLKKKKSSRRHKDEGTISVSKSSSKLSKKIKAVADGNDNPQCEKCARPVYAMERVKAEKRTWHKECFRCVQCNKSLTMETYQSDHTALYCRQHFKQLFEPRPVEEDQADATPKKHQMIICESNPVELPPDVVRASDKPDLGLEELSSLDVKSRFEMFERARREATPPPEARAPREKSAKLLSKLAKFKAKGMDVGVSDEYLNGIPAASSSEPEDEEDEDAVLKRSYQQAREQPAPPSAGNMSELVGRFESGRSDERRRNRKQEIQNIRSRLFMGKQAKIKEMYEQSVMQSEQSITSAEKIAKELDLELERDSDRARALKMRFESGELFQDENQPPKQNNDIDVVRDGIAKKSRSIFLELDANAASAAPEPPAHQPPKRKEIPFIPKDVVRAADKLEDVHIETADISDRFRFFETYRPEDTRKEFRMTPPREIQRPKSPSPEVYRDPAVARAAPGAGAARLAPRDTARRMIDVFRTLETRQDPPQGPKPLKCFTPPPPGAYTRDSSSEYSSSGEEEEEDSEDERRRHMAEARERDEAYKQAQQLARTKSFRDRFENWRENEPQRSPSNIVIERGGGGGEGEEEEDGESQLETAKSLRAKFESMNVTQSSVAKNATRVNRFV